MGKKRIFEIAKEYGVKSPEVIELLAKHNISKTNFSSVDDSEAAIIHAAANGRECGKVKTGCTSGSAESKSGKGRASFHDCKAGHHDRRDKCGGQKHDNPQCPAERQNRQTVANGKQTG